MACVLIAAFVLVERRVREPLLDLALFRRRSFDGALLDNLVYNITLAGTMYVLALYLEEVRGYDALTAGLYLLPSTVSMLVFIPIGARLELRRGPRFPLATGTLIMGVGTFLAGVLATDTPYWWYATAIFIQGVGIGLFSTPLSDTAVGLAPPAESGAASGAFKMCSMVGGALGVALMGGIYRGLQLAQLHGDADAAHLTADQQKLVNDAFQSTEKAQEIYKTLAPERAAEGPRRSARRPLLRHRRLAQDRRRVLRAGRDRRAAPGTQGHPAPRPTGLRAGARRAPPGYPARRPCRILFVRSPGSPGGASRRGVRAGLRSATGNRVGGVNLPRGFESLPLRHFTTSPEAVQRLFTSLV